MAKNFKLSLCVFFSKMTKQSELPEGASQSIEIIEPEVVKFYQELYFKPRGYYRQMTFLQDLLMSKGLCNPVPQDMILKAYEKHWRTLSSVGSSPVEFLEEFRRVLDYFGKEFSKEDLTTTKTPSRSAYLGCKRSQGGLLNHLKSSFRPKGYRSMVENRVDPIVVHLQGLPGIGKSYITSRIYQEIGKAFGFRVPRYMRGNPNLSSFVYNRTIGTDHWDGYNNQLISSIDDFGCVKERQTQDYATLMQLSSDQDFVLPMAALEDKGKKFNSNFLFISTNGIFESKIISSNTRYQLDELACPPALKRRISPTYNLFRLKKGKQSIYRVLVDDGEGLVSPNHSDFEGTTSQVIKFLTEHILSRWDSRFSEKFQPVKLNGPFEEGYGFYFPSSPPDRLPECEAHAIPEPCKVRMITKNEPETWIVKPIQMAMWNTLGKFPVFSLTHGPDIDLSRLTTGKYLVSGDYEASTDQLHKDIMETAVDVLQKYIQDESLRKWFIWEGGSHKIHYPAWTNLPPITQTRGQLMGSLLSFPILCLANFTSFAVAYKKRWGIEPIDLLKMRKPPVFINGDDILFTCDGKRDTLYTSWKTTSSSIGLKPSVGKCYFSDRFGIINSQMILKYDRIKKRKHLPYPELQGINQHLIYDDGSAVTRHRSLVQILHGKVKNYNRFQCEPSGLDFSLALKTLGPELVLKFNKPILSKTPESLDLPHSLGGIGILNPKYTPTEQDKMIYAFKYLRHEPKIWKTLPNDCVVTRLPRNVESILSDKFGTIVTDFTGDLDFNPKTYTGEYFDYVGFRRFKQFVNRTPNLRETIKNLDLLKAIPLEETKRDLVVLRSIDFERYVNIAKNFGREVPNFSFDFCEELIQLGTMKNNPLDDLPEQLKFILNLTMDRAIGENNRLPAQSWFNKMEDLAVRDFKVDTKIVDPKNLKPQNVSFSPITDIVSFRSELSQDITRDDEQLSLGSLESDV